MNAAKFVFVTFLLAVNVGLAAHHVGYHLGIVQTPYYRASLYLICFSVVSLGLLSLSVFGDTVLALIFEDPLLTVMLLGYLFVNFALLALILYRVKTAFNEYQDNN